MVLKLGIPIPIRTCWNPAGLPALKEYDELCTSVSKAVGDLAHALTIVLRAFIYGHLNLLPPKPFLAWPLALLLSLSS